MDPPTRFDRYEILATLGVGGMGEVVKARALGPHGFSKLVAIKRIKGEWAQQEQMAERFIREARIAARLQHSNIVHVFDFGRHGDELFIVMEYVEGQALDDILAGLAANGKRPTLQQTLEIAVGVARALDVAHTLENESGQIDGIIHRDVSPANILISRKGTVKLTDFGIAAIAAQQQARTSLVAGKPMYMAPEQLRGDPLDGRADLFALGLVMYEMITGARPWTGIVDPSPDASLEGMDYRPPSTRATQIPAQVDALIARLLAPARDDRPATAREVVKELLQLAYDCQIILDSSELCPLVGEGRADAHAATQPSQPSKIETLIATGVSPDGMTMLAPGSAPSVTPPQPTSWRRARGATWVPVAVVLSLFGAAGVAFVILGEDEAASDAVASAHQPPEPVTPIAGEGDAGATGATVDAAPTEPAADPRNDAGADLGTLIAAALDPDPDPRGRTTHRSTRVTHVAGEEAPAPTGEPGELDVFSRPWAEIYIDGVRQPQNAPVRGIPVASGRHRVRLVNPVLGLEREVSVVVPPGGRGRVRVFLDGSQGAEEE